MRARELWWVGLESSFIKFFWSVCSEPTISVKGAFPGKEKGCKSFWAPMIPVGVVWAAPHRMCLQRIMGFCECKHFSNACWSQPDVSDTHVSPGFCFSWSKMPLLLSAEVDCMNFPHGHCCSDSNSFPLMLLSVIYIQVPEFSMVCRKSGFLKHSQNIYIYF